MNGERYVGVTVHSPFHGCDEFKRFNRFARFQLLRTFSRKEVFGARRPFGLSPTQLSELNGIGSSGLTILATTLHGRIG
jgi:hypothetical protein